jgi:HEAT repeat protein
MNRSSCCAALPLVLGLVACLAVAGCSRPAVAPPPQAGKPAAQATRPDTPATEEADSAVAVAPPTAAPKTDEPMPQTPRREKASDQQQAAAASGAKQPTEDAVGDTAGTESVAALVETLTTTDDSRTRVITIDAIANRLRGGLPALDAFVAALADEEPRVRWHAARAIGLIGFEAAPAIPALVKLLADEDPITVTQAAAAIGHIRADDERAAIPPEEAAIYAAAIEPLVAAMVHPDPRARRAAVRSLRRLSTSREELAKTVRQQLADADPVAVLPALHTLADLEQEAVPFLIEALGDPKSRFWAEVVLAEIGEKAAAAVEPLAAIAAEGEVEERVQAILSLARIGPAAKVAAPQLVAALESPDDSLQYVAAYALGRLRIDEGDATLEKAAASDDPFLSTIASWARARIHPEDADLRAKAVERLEIELADESPDLRRAAVEGLSGLADNLDAEARKKLAGQLTAMITDPVPTVGLAAGGALIRLGGDAVDALREAVAVGSLRSDAMEILAVIGPAARPALDEMVTGLADADPIYRADSAMAIAAVGPEAEAAVPALEKLLGDESALGQVRYAAVYALGRIGPAAVAAEPLLRKLAESDDELMATVAVWAALKIKPDDATLFGAAIPKLRRALKNEKELVRLEAAVALGEIGPPAATAIPMLEMLAEEDPSRTVRQAAAGAARMIKPAE